MRETKDGCDPCPGPFGGPRNRTAEAGGSRGGVEEQRFQVERATIFLRLEEENKLGEEVIEVALLKDKWRRQK